MVLLVAKVSYAVIALAFAALGYFRPKRRWTAWFAALAATCAGIALWRDAFWPLAVFSVLALLGALCSIHYIDLGWRVRASVVLGLCLIAFVALWPSVDALSRGRVPCPAWVKDRVASRLVAGLDLRGGLRLVYNVEVDEAIRDKRDRYYEEMRNELVKLFGFHSGEDLPPESAQQKLKEKLTITAPRNTSDVIRITLVDPADSSKIDARFLERFQGDLTYALSGDRKTFEFRVKSSLRANIRERAVTQAREIILRRVDELGLREASVSTRDDDVIIEVPGESEASFAQVRDIVSQTARLEFKLLDDETDFFLPISRQTARTGFPEGLEFLREVAPIGLDESGDIKTKQTTYAFLPKKPDETSKQTLLRLKEWAATLELPQDREIGFEVEYRTDPDTLVESEAGIRTYLLKSRAEITGDLVRDAQATPSQEQKGMGGWHVAITFTDQGGRIFDRITSANVRRRFAIILDGRVESAPVILARIPGGHASITLGSNDPQVQLRDARKLELVLRSGALPAPITPTNEQTIGPTLGKDAIERAVQAAVAGSLLVLLFMFVYYRRAGLIADIVVVMNLVLQLAILASFGASITLPGICGLALTLGMSVDSNVLINERLREETRAGKKPRSALDVGFDRALNAIIDGHATTLISGIVLAQFGTGPIKGFATALLVGMAANLFTGVVVSRVLFDFWVRGLKTPRLDLG
jgi:preprotein translocase subunit SecD